MNFQFIFAFSETNFRISQQNLHFDFKNAWKMLEKVTDPALAGEAANPQNFNFEKLRKGRDSNPGNPFEFNTLAVCCFRPLSHLSKISIQLCGESEIRTHGELPHDGFQDRCLQPLGHLS